MPVARGGHDGKPTGNNEKRDLIHIRPRFSYQGTMSSFFTPLLHLPLLFLVSPRVGQIQYRIDNARNRIGGMVLHFMFLFHVLFCDLLRLFRCRIQFIENIGRKFFSQ